MATRSSTTDSHWPRSPFVPLGRWLGRLAVVAAVAAVTLWVHLYEFNGFTQWDSAAFLAIGKLLQRGLLLYRDLWDTKPPGIYLYQSAVYAVLPVEVWSLRFTDYALYVGAGLAFFWLCRRQAGWPLALAGTALWLYFSHHPNFNIAGFYTEEYMSMAAIVAVAAAAHWWQRGAGWALVACGVFAALAVIFKHPGVACGVPILVLISGRRPLLAIAVVTLCGALPLAAVVGWFWWQGALDAFLDCQFLHLLSQHSVTQPVPLALRLAELQQRTLTQLAPYPIVLIAGAGAVICLLRPTRLRLAAAGWLAADLALISAQKFYYEHYFIQLFPSALLCGVLGAAWLLEHRRGERWFVALARLALAVAAVAIVWQPLHEVVARRQPVVDQAWLQLRAGPGQWPHAPGGPYEAEIGEYLKARTAPEDRIFIYETGTGLAAYWTAERLPASRYIFSIVPQSSFARQAELLAELERTRPAYVVVTGGPAERFFSPYLRANYELAEEKWGGYRVEIWGRMEPAPFALGASDGVAADADRGGLVLADGARRGSWTSPPLEVLGDPGRLPVACRAEPAVPPAPGVGMGVAVRYRTGSTPDLTATPWVAVEQGEGPRMVQAARYVQIQCELGGDVAGAAPVLRLAQVGRVRFQLEALPPVVERPLRTCALPRSLARNCALGRALS